VEIIRLQKAQTRLHNVHVRLEDAIIRHGVLQSELSVVESQREQMTQVTRRLKAELNLCLTARFSRMLDRLGSAEAIAQEAGIDLDKLWRLVGGSYALSSRRFPDERAGLREDVTKLALLDPQLEDTPTLLGALEDFLSVREQQVVLIGRHQDVLKKLEDCAEQRTELQEAAYRADAELQEALSSRESAPTKAPARRQQRRRTAIPDAEGHECKPDPIQAQTPAEFVATLRQYRKWAGNPSFREMERNSAGRASYSTFSNMLRAAAVPPRFKSVEAFVVALGGNEEDLRIWASAWRRFQPDVGERTPPHPLRAIRPADPRELVIRVGATRAG
jgi:hypothetical protein